jgi:hypothetical protein
VGDSQGHSPPAPVSGFHHSPTLWTPLWKLLFLIPVVTQAWWLVLFEGSGKVSGGLRSVTESDHPSREVTAPYRVLNLETLAPALLRRSPLALGHFGPGFRVFTFQAPEKQMNAPRDPLMGFGPSSEVAQAPSRCPEPLVFQEPDVRLTPNAN